MIFNIQLESIMVFLFIPIVFAALFIKPRDRWMPLRILIYILAFTFILRPYLLIKSQDGEVGEIGVFIDNSFSMSLENRSDIAKDEAKKIVSVLKNNFNIKLYKFGESVQELKGQEIDYLKPTDKITDISKPIQEAHLKDVIIIISDGAHNSGPHPVSLRELTRLPVFTIGVGGERESPDLEIADLKVGGFGFRGQEIEVSFNILNASKSKDHTTVYLKEGNVVISRNKISLGSNENIPVIMKFIPTELGVRNYTLLIEKIRGEINTANNLRNFQILVKREKIRILYVAGQPSWEYSFLRRILKSDPKIELVTFLILRNPQNVTIVPEYELSLIHFPAREMFTREIYEFDLLIYDNFSYGRFFPKAYLTHIKNFVMKGGGFIMLGGEDSFQRGGYVNTAIEEILPLDMKEDNSSWLLDKFEVLPHYSLAHPILNLADDKKISAQIWKEMPSLEGYDPTLTPKKDATILLKNPKGHPILAVWNVGKGRVMAFNANTTWRWCMGLAAEGKSPFYYNLFWRNVMRYMIQSGELNNVEVFPGKDIASIGERISINIRVVDRYWKPLNDATVRMELVQPDGTKLPVGVVYPTGSDGWYHTTVPVIGEGIHKIIVSAYHKGRFLSSGKGFFSGITLNKELMKTALNRRLLKDIADTSGGYYWDAKTADLDKIISKVEDLLIHRTQFKRVSWHHWLFYLSVLLIITVEWYVRRRRGLT